MARAGADAEEAHPELDLDEETTETTRSAIQDV